jgi:hypothetical protein
MQRFHFHLRARGTIHRDPDGTDLADLAAARAHGSAVAEELMCHSGGGTRHWSMRVEDEAGQWQFDLFFADVDPTLASYSPQMRMQVSETCRRLGALTDVLCAARATQIESRMLLARAQRKPYLVYARGE